MIYLNIIDTPISMELLRGIPTFSNIDKFADGVKVEYFSLWQFYVVRVLFAVGKEMMFLSFVIFDDICCFETRISSLLDDDGLCALRWWFERWNNNPYCIRRTDENFELSTVCCCGFGEAGVEVGKGPFAAAVSPNVEDEEGGGGRGGLWVLLLERLLLLTKWWG